MSIIQTKFFEKISSLNMPSQQGICLQKFETLALKTIGHLRYLPHEYSAFRVYG